MSDRELEWTSLDEMMAQVRADRYYATCTNDSCDNYQEVEPDAAYKCPECKKGRLVSPLIKMGII